MRTTVRLDDALLREAKKAAASSGRTLAAVIEDALRAHLSRRGRVQRAPFKMRTFDGGGLLPGVDLDDSSALLDLMEGRPPAPH